MPSQSAIPVSTQEKEYISTRRALNILGVTQPTTLSRLAAAGRIRLVPYKKTGRVHYGSLVEFCDRIREAYRIEDRRPKLSAPNLGHRDEDVLPFPLADTISAEEACAALGKKNKALLDLIEGGYFEAYQLMQSEPWRVSRSSLFAFVERVRSSGQFGKAFGLKFP